MERPDRARVTTFFAGDAVFERDAALTLGADAARHARVLRLEAGAGIRVVDGAGRRAQCTVIRVTKDAVVATVASVEAIEPLPPVHLLVPIADRERMLWLAEKATELGVTSWRPVLWRRSRGVRPRGEGPMFTERLRRRMQAALEQSSGGHLPVLYPEASPAHALAAVPEGRRVVLDDTGAPLLAQAIDAPLTLAVGPEGGFADEELAALAAAGFVRASLARTILRFETAAIAGLAIARASIAASGDRHGA